MARRSFPVAASVAAASLVAFLVPACGALTPSARPMSARVVVNGKAQHAPFGSTLGWLISNLHLTAHDGRLLSVTGATLDAHADPGRIELDGRRAPADTVLVPRDAIDVLDGEDHVEPVRRTV